MAIKVSGTEVISGSRQLSNIASIDATTQSTFQSSLNLNNRAVGTVTGNATLDLSTGTIFEHTPTADTTFVFSNPPASGTGYSFDLKVTGDTVASPWSVANTSVGSFFNTGQGFLGGLDFKPDGSKVYVASDTSNTVVEYDLSTNWDVTTATLVQSFALSNTDARSLRFKPDGLKMYVGDIGTDVVYEYILTTAWDISTASLSANSLNASAQDSAITSLFIRSDGTEFFIVGISTDSVYKYTLSTAWDISTASYSGQSFSIASQSSSPTEIFFKSDGTKFWVTDNPSAKIYEYSLTTPWDLTTATYTSISASVISNPQGLYIKPDGTTMYISEGISGGRIYPYTISGTAPATFTYPASVSWLDASAPTDPAAGEVLSLQFFTTDGGTTYYGSKNGNLFTDADHTKLDGIESGATADQTGAEIKSLYEAEADTNAYTDAEKTKLAGIETGADVTDAANVEPLVDTHLNTSSATAGQALSWNGSDYEWATTGAINDVFYENSTTVSTDYTITSGKNAVSAGPVTIASGVTVTVPTGSRWAVV